MKHYNLPVGLLQKGDSADFIVVDNLSLQEAEEKIRLGMKIQIREGSAAKNFDSLIDIVKVYPDMVMLCSDDCHPDDLLNGYFVGLLKRA